MRVIALVLACSFLKGSAIPKGHDQSLNALETLLLARESLHAPRSIVRERPGKTREALRLRGGSDVADTTAKIMTALSTLTGLQSTFAPKSAYDAYGIKVGTKKKDKKKNDMLDFILEKNGVTTLGTAALSWAMINGADPMKAIGYGYVPAVLTGLKNIKDKRATKIGIPEFVEKFATALNGFFAFSFLTGQSYCPMLSKIAGGWTLLNGVFAALRPKKFGKSWGFEDLDGVSAGLMKILGYQCMGIGHLVAAVGQGIELNEALAYVYGIYLTSLVDSLFISKGFADIKKAPLYVWMVLQTAAIAALKK